MFDIVREVAFGSKAEPHLERANVNQLRDKNVVSNKKRNRCKL